MRFAFNFAQMCRALGLWSFTAGAVCFSFAAFASKTTAPTLSELNLSVWSEFLPYKSVELQLPKLKEKHLTLLLAVRQDRPDYDGLAELMAHAARLQVEVRPWLLLDESDGYWFNKWNFEAAQRFTNEFLEQMARRSIKPSWLIFDVEPPHDMIKTVRDHLAKLDLKGARKILADQSKNGSIKGANANYSALVRSLHTRGIKVEVVAPSFALHDLKNKKLKIQSAFGLPVTEVPFDQFSFMVYRADLHRMIATLSARIVLLEAKRAQKAFGDKASLALGEIGWVGYPSTFEGYSERKDLEEDLTAASDAGIRKLEVYSLDGALAKGLDFWFPSLDTPLARSTKSERRADLFLKLLDWGSCTLPPGR